MQLMHFCPIGADGLRRMNHHSRLSREGVYVGPIDPPNNFVNLQEEQIPQIAPSTCCVTSMDRRLSYDASTNCLKPIEHFSSFTASKSESVKIFSTNR
jgi:hypothetical protein